MSNFNFYKADKAYGELFFQFPKVFLYSKKYKKLSNDAKIAYMVFKDRLQYSLKNNWIDKENNVYFIFTNDEICQMLDMSKPTAIKIKKELEEVGLLLQVQQGFNPRKKRNEPNRLYMADLEVEATDIYSFQNSDSSLETLDTSGSKNSLPRREKNINAETLDTSGSKNSLPRQKNAETLDTSGSKNSLLELDRTKSFKDFKDNKESEKNDKCDTNLISNAFESKEKELEIQLMNDYIQENSYEFIYGEELLNKFKAYSFNDFDTFVMFTSKLVYAHKSVEKETNIVLSIHEDTQYSDFTRGELVKTFNRCIQAQRFNKANNIANYLFVSFKNVFKDLAETVINKKTQPEGKMNVPIEF